MMVKKNPINKATAKMVAITLKAFRLNVLILELENSGSCAFTANGRAITVAMAIIFFIVVVFKYCIIY
jgi:hypothetical protein